MKYKEELLDNAETRKGTKIPRAEIENWLGREKELEDELRNLRIQSFAKSLEMKLEIYFRMLQSIQINKVILLLHRIIQ